MIILQTSIYLSLLFSTRFVYLFIQESSINHIQIQAVVAIVVVVVVVIVIIVTTVLCFVKWKKITSIYMGKTLEIQWTKKRNIKFHRIFYYRIVLLYQVVILIFSIIDQKF